MNKTLVLMFAPVLCGCSAMSFVDDTFDSCAYEAEKASITVEDSRERLSRRSDFTAACMRAHGYRLKEAADKSKVDSYSRRRWF